MLKQSFLTVELYGPLLEFNCAGWGCCQAGVRDPSDATRQLDDLLLPASRRAESRLRRVIFSFGDDASANIVTCLLALANKQSQGLPFGLREPVNMVRRPCRNEIMHSPRRDASANEKVCGDLDLRVAGAMVD